MEDAFAGMGGNEQGGPRLMVIHEPHVVGVAVLEAEDQALQAADPDRVEPGAVAGKGMQAVARQGDVAGGALDALVGERADRHARSGRLSRPAGVGDGDAAGGAFDDGGDGGGPGEALAVGDGDEGAGEVVGEAVGGGSGQGGSPAVVEAAGPPAGDRGGRRRRGIGRGGICVRGEVLLEGVEQDLAGPGGHIQVALLAQGGEALEGLAGEADLEGGVAGHASMVPVLPASSQVSGTPTAMNPLG